MPELKIRSEFQYVSLGTFKLQLEIIHERRSSARISLAKHKAILRLPLLMSIVQKEKHLQWAHNWLHKKFQSEPILLNRYIPKNYQTGQLIQLRDREFVLNVKEDAQRKTAAGSLKKNTIYIELPEGIDAFQKHKLCATIISRIMSSVFLPDITVRVHELNERFIKKSIRTVRLKLNVSNWGSCSTNNIINLSSRLLLTPQFITDYIIIHELAHLVHMNHSKKYWNLVEQIMPEYKKAEAWLDKFGERCNF